MLSVSCSATPNLFASLQIRNIGQETIYVKFVDADTPNFAIYEWHDCREPWDDMTYYEDLEVKIETSFYNGYWDGCALTINFDETIGDIILNWLSKYNLGIS